MFNVFIQGLYPPIDVLHWIIDLVICAFALVIMVGILIRFLSPLLGGKQRRRRIVRPVSPIDPSPSDGSCGDPHTLQQKTDMVVDRNRGIRRITFVSFLVLGIAIPFKIGWLLGIKFETVGSGCVIGLVIGVILIAILLSKFIMMVPEKNFAVSMNIFGDLIPYGPGFSAKLPWPLENVTTNSHRSLEVMTKLDKVEVPSIDAALEVEYQIQWEVNLCGNQGVIFYTQSIGTIHSAIAGIIRSYLAKEFSKKRSKEVRHSSEVYSKMIKTFFESGGKTSLEIRYGINIISVEIKNIDLVGEAKVARDRIASGELFMELVARMLNLDIDNPADKPEIAKAMRDETIIQMVDRQLAASGNKQVTIERLAVNMNKDANINDAIAPALLKIVTDNKGTSKK